jgi:hypothetical protein
MNGDVLSFVDDTWTSARWKSSLGAIRGTNR